MHENMCKSGCTAGFELRVAYNAYHRTRTVSCIASILTILSHFYRAIVMLAVIYIFYTIPLTTAAQLANYAQLDSLFPKVAEWTNSNFGFNVTHLLSGLISAIIFTTFFGLCPSMFKSIANFGSGAVSFDQAEFSALQYYWWFMVVTAFTGQLLANMVINAIKEGSLGVEIADVLRQVATTIPSTLSAAWINWTVLRIVSVCPLNYLLNVNTFAFSWLGWNCCSRMMRGGGPGGPTPYRLYIDTGTVLVSQELFVCEISCRNQSHVDFSASDVLRWTGSVESVSVAGEPLVLSSYGATHATKPHLCLSTKVRYGRQVSTNSYGLCIVKC